MQLKGELGKVKGAIVTSSSRLGVGSTLVLRPHHEGKRIPVPGSSSSHALGENAK